MASRLCVFGSLVLVVCACQKNRDDIQATGSTSGSGISASANGSGGAGSGGSTSGSGGASSSGGDGGSGVTSSASSAPGSGGAPTTSSGGEGGDPTGGGGAPAGPTSGSGGGIPETCGADGECWGDDPSPCGFDICEVIFPECEPDVPSAFGQECGSLSAVIRVDVWAHIVDCMRDAGAEAGCTEDGTAIADACLAQSLDEACPSDAVDAVCEDREAACAGFDVDGCKRDVAIYNDLSLGNYDSCLDEELENGTACADLHGECS